MLGPCEKSKTNRKDKQKCFFTKEMKCVCCLNGSEDRKLTSFTATNKKQFAELTRLEIPQKALKICADCKSQLKSSIEFLRMCLISYEKIETETEEVTKPKRTRRNLKKAVSEEYLDCTGNEDSMPGIEPQEDELEINEDVPLLSIQEEPPDDKPASLKYLCNECGITFKTSQRLQVHSYTHSGVKSWKCSDCDKVFATKFRLKAHYSEFFSSESS